MRWTSPRANRALDEHWNGSGRPSGRSGEDIPLLGRILCLSQTVEVFCAAVGPGEAIEVAAARRGTWLDPDLVDALTSLPIGDSLWSSLAEDDPAGSVAQHDPGDHMVTVGDAQLDGSGYHRGIGADQMTPDMRILAVADIYEALTAHRPYRNGMPVEQAMRIIGSDVPHRLDADAFAALQTWVQTNDPAVLPEGDAAVVPITTPRRAERRRAA